MKKKFIKSEAEDQFEIDEEMVNEIADSDEFKDLEITNDDIIEAIQAIDALADAVIEKADVEEKKLDADVLLDEVRDMIDDSHEEEEEELEKEEELPEELTNSVVRVMVSDEDEITVEKTPDEIYPTEVDGVDCTVYDTCDLPPIEVEDVGNPDENTDDDLLIIGNSKATKFKKGFVKLNSSVSKKAWSAAYRKVKKMVGSSKLTAAHWVIVSALAKKEEEKDKKKKKIECALIKYIRSNKILKSKLLKSSDEIDSEGQPIAETKPEETVGKGNNGFEGTTDVTEVKSPEIVDSQSGNPVEDPEKQVEREDEVVLPEGEMIILEVPLTNSKQKFRLKKVQSSKGREFVAYKVLNAKQYTDVLDGKVLKSGKVAFMFKDTANGLLACAARFVNAGKGKYTTVLKNNKVVITKGVDCKIFNSVERLMNVKSIISARRNSMQEGKQRIRSSRDMERNYSITSSRRRPVKSSRDRVNPERSRMIRERIQSSRMEQERRRRLIANARVNVAKRKEQEAIQSKVNLQRKQNLEERQRLFQNSQNVMNQERIEIKQGANRNADALDKMYNGLF